MTPHGLGPATLRPRTRSHWPTTSCACATRWRSTAGGLWDVASALRAAPEPYALRSAYAVWYRTRRSDALRGIVCPPSRPCSFCGGSHTVLYLVPPSQWRRQEDGSLRLCPACYLQHLGSSAYWLLPEDEWSI